jgi:hypothetical protein
LATRTAHPHGGAALERDEITTLIGEGTKALAAAVANLARPLRHRLARERDGTCVLIEAALHSTALPAVARTSPLLPSLLRGARQRRALLHAEGGTLSGEQVASALGISRQAVDKQRQRGRLLAVREGAAWRYPSWQLADGRVLAGLPGVLRILAGQSPWTTVAFLTSQNTRLGSRRPLDLLRRGNVEPVLKAADAYGEHGAT